MTIITGKILHAMKKFTSVNTFQTLQHNTNVERILKGTGRRMEVQYSLQKVVKTDNSSSQLLCVNTILLNGVSISTLTNIKLRSGGGTGEFPMNSLQANAQILQMLMHMFNFTSEISPIDYNRTSCYSKVKYLHQCLPVQGLNIVQQDMPPATKLI